MGFFHEGGGSMSNQAELLTREYIVLAKHLLTEALLPGRAAIEQLDLLRLAQQDLVRAIQRLAQDIPCSQ